MAGTSIMEQQAAAGLKLFEAQSGTVEVDLAAAEKHKGEIDEQIAALEAQVAQLTGKDNKKERSAKSKEISDLRSDPKFVDACKVVKGLEPKNGFFAKSEPKAAPLADSAPVQEAPAHPEAKKEGKEKRRKEESAGLSPAETKELEQLKKDIVDRKAQLKAEGMSGGQQNKDPQVVEWVTRMNELKEKQEPGSTQQDKKKEKEGKKKSSAPLSSEEQKELDKLRGEIDTYKHRLRTEFGYTNKDIKADDDLKDMEARLAELERRSG